MTIRNEAMMSRYFDRLMSPGEEQNFLITLAASDELRLAFRSQLELMKAIRDDKHDMRPIAEVRSRTLTALGLTGAITAPFLEQALLHEDAQAATEVAASTIRHSFFSRLSGKMFLAGSGLATGFLAAALFFGQSANIGSKGPAQVPTPSVQTPITSPTVQPTVADAKHELKKASSIRTHSGAAVRKAATVEPSASTDLQPAGTKSATDENGPGGIQLQKHVVTPDSATK